MSENRTGKTGSAAPSSEKECGQKGGEGNGSEETAQFSVPEALVLKMHVMTADAVKVLLWLIYQGNIDRLAWCPLPVVARGCGLSEELAEALLRSLHGQGILEFAPQGFRMRHGLTRAQWDLPP